VAATASITPADRIDALKRIRDTGAITLGVRETSVPFSFVDAQQWPHGYSVDLCLRVAEAIKAVDEGRAIAFPMDDVLLYVLISGAKKPTISRW
jgi:ABC-type amino acid transport substrate-binding protein